MITCVRESSLTTTPGHASASSVSRLTTSPARLARQSKTAMDLGSTFAVFPAEDN